MNIEMLQWQESFTVGVKEIDDQHKYLITLINRLISNRKASVDSPLIEDTLSEMTKYAQYHFQAEEQYMANAGYPYTSLHEEEHRNFKEKTATFCVDVMKHKVTIPIELLTFLKDWLTNHILKTDMHLREYLRKK